MTEREWRGLFDPKPTDGTPYRIRVPYFPDTVVIQWMHRKWYGKKELRIHGLPLDYRGKTGLRYVAFDAWSPLTEDERKEFDRARAAPSFGALK